MFSPPCYYYLSKHVKELWLGVTVPRDAAICTMVSRLMIQLVVSSTQRSLSESHSLGDVSKLVYSHVGRRTARPRSRTLAHECIHPGRYMYASLHRLKFMVYIRYMVKAEYINIFRDILPTTIPVLRPLRLLAQRDNCGHLFSFLATIPTT